ncbi:MAG: cytidylate kinase family protein [Patescibacteria group bacterium]
MIITLSGAPGSGKSTVGRLVEGALNLNRYSMGDLRRHLAQERGMTIDAWNTLGETSDETDVPVDEHQRTLGKQEDNFIIDGRISWYFIPHSFKVFLDVDPDEGARRMFAHSKEGARTSEKPYTSAEEVRHQAAKRSASDNVRYEKYYGIHWDDKSRFDLVLDTTAVSPEDVAERVIKAAKAWESSQKSSQV